MNKFCESSESGDVDSDAEDPEQLLNEWLGELDSLTGSNEPEGLTEHLDETLQSEDSFLEDTNQDNTCTSRSNTPLKKLCDVTPSSSRTSSSLSRIVPSSSRISSVKLKKKQEQEKQDVLGQCLSIMSKSADSFEIFGDYVADKLRNMSSKAPDLQSWSKREIQRILLKINDNYEF